MDRRAIKFDWNRARAFLVTAEEGSLSAAARALNMTQPTLLTSFINSDGSGGLDLLVMNFSSGVVNSVGTCQFGGGGPTS